MYWLMLGAAGVDTVLARRTSSTVELIVDLHHDDRSLTRDRRLRPVSHGMTWSGFLSEASAGPAKFHHLLAGSVEMSRAHTR